MRKFYKKMLVSIVVFSMLFSTNVFINDLFAQEEIQSNDLTEVNSKLQKDTEITTMDEDGNIHLLKDIESKISSKHSRIISQPKEKVSANATAVVNFRIYSSEQINTDYKEVTTGRAGYTNGYYAADGAFLGYDSSTNPTKVKFMQAGVVGWVDINKVEVLNYSSTRVQTLSKYYVKNGRLYHGISSNLSNSGYSSTLDFGIKPDYLKEGYSYYSYDGHYFYEGDSEASYAKMLKDYRNGVRTNAINSTSPYYNYYQYLPHRSITSYSTTEINNAIASMVGASEKSTGRVSKLRNTANAFISNQNKHGTNALLMLGVAVNESAWGCSKIAANKNNLFGHGAVDSNPYYGANGYTSVDQSILYHSAIFISKGYLDPVTDTRYYGAHLGDKASGIGVNYASDPYWGEKAAAICWKIDSRLGNKDANKYKLAIKDTINTKHSVVNVKSDASSVSSTLYSTYPVSLKTTYKNYAPSNFPFIILNGDKNNYYKVQSDGAVNNNRNGIINSPSQSEYSFSKDYGYILKSDVTVLGGNNKNPDVDTENTVGMPTGKDVSAPTILYTANSQNTGWLNQVTEPNSAGTTGRSLALYQLKINLINSASTAKLSGKVYSNGTWLNYSEITPNTVLGNSNKSMSLVNFSLKNQPGYQLQYRVHSANVGWQAWTAQGNNAGTNGSDIQAIEFRLLKINDYPTVTYATHIEDYGWQNTKSDGQLSGFVGQAKRLEAIKIGLTDNQKYSGNIQYQAHVQDYGWQAWKTNNTIAGTIGSRKRLEAIRIKLNGQLAEKFDVYYRVHVQEFGWLDWAKNGESAGTSEYSYRLEGIEIQLIDKNQAAPGSTKRPYIQKHYISYATHIENYGWQENKYDGEMSGTSGEAKRLEAIKINLENARFNGNLEYKTHIQDYGWESKWKTDNQISGTSGSEKRLEAIQIKLTDEMANKYDVYYRVHAQNNGWLGWAKNGQSAGTEGYGYRLEAIEIVLIEKGNPAPISTNLPFKSKK